MARLIVLVEGQTEETFVNELLRGHLYGYGYEMVSARLMGNARLREKRGGIRAWNSVKRDILNHLKEDKGCMVTTMVDYYRLPQSGNNAWPGRAEAPKLPFIQKAKTIEKMLSDDVFNEMDKNFNRSRFIPFIIMHEFEGLLFSDCELFAIGIGCESLSDSLQEIRDQFSSPEEINDSPHTAPSKRVETLISDYQKPFHGNLAAIKIGLKKIRAVCPHFNEWVGKLENTPNTLIKKFR